MNDNIAILFNNIAPEGNPIYNFSDNSKYRGTWDVWLRDTVYSDNEADRRAICKSIVNFTKGAGCRKCRDHSKEYVAKNPPLPHAVTKEKFFTYLVTFMNTIQKENKKKLYNLDILYSVFDNSEAGVCDEDDCGADKEIEVVKTESKSIKRSVNAFDKPQTLKVGSIQLYQNNNRGGISMRRQNIM